MPQVAPVPAAAPAVPAAAVQLMNRPKAAGPAPAVPAVVARLEELSSPSRSQVRNGCSNRKGSIGFLTNRCFVYFCFLGHLFFDIKLLGYVSC